MAGHIHLSQRDLQGERHFGRRPFLVDEQVENLKLFQTEFPFYALQ